MKFDLADIMSKIIAEYPELGIYAEIIDIVVTFGINEEDFFTNINTAAVTFPVLTQANSVDMIEWLGELFAFGYGYEPSPMYEYEPVKVFLDFDYIYFPDAKPLVIDGRTMVPASILFRALGGDMFYEEINGVEIITGYLGDNTVKLTIGSNIALVNGKEVALDVAAYINEDDRTMVPLRFIAENFGYSVDYEADIPGFADIVVFIISPGMAEFYN